MAVFTTNSPLSSRSAPAAAPANSPKPDVYANIGYWANDPETGEQIFISLPYGVGIDTMSTLRAGSNEMMQAKNQLLIELQEAAKELAPGEEREIPLVVTIRRKAEHTQQTAGNNSFIAQMEGLGC